MHRKRCHKMSRQPDGQFAQHDGLSGSTEGSGGSCRFLLLVAVCAASSHIYACTTKGAGLLVGSFHTWRQLSRVISHYTQLRMHALCQALRITRAGMGKDPVAL